MPLLRLRSVCVSFLVAISGSACGDDKGGTDGSTSNPTAATDATATGATATDATASVTEPGTTEPTGDPTADPTAGPAGMYCQEECSGDADCKEMGMDFGFICVDKRCTVEVAEGCKDDMDCQVQLSGWTMACTAQADCPGQVCVDIGGEGRCAFAPSDLVMCETFNQVEVSLTLFPEGDAVMVCSNTDYECGDDGVCTNPCQADTDCTLLAAYPKCNVGTGICECGSDADCATLGSPAQSVCHMGFCGCGTDADCTGMNTDVCNEGGLCGCSATSVCTQQSFDGTTPVCAGP